VNLLKLLGIALATVTLASPVMASDAVMCVQEMLTELGYDAGPSDGAMGKRTTSASKALATDFKLSLPDLTADTAQAWCDAAKGAAASPTAAVFKSKARLLLPVDVLLALAQAPAEEAANLCKARGGTLGLDIDPVMKIEGFTSRMADVVDTLPHARDLERFVAVFGGQAVLALATHDEALKESLIKILAKWAAADALLATRSCVKPNGDVDFGGKCTEWTVKDGSDLSGMKDATFTTLLGIGLIRAYYAALADANPEGLKTEHSAITGWIEKFAQRIARPTEVQFGLNVGWYWPAVVNDMVTGNQERARKRLAMVDAGLAKQIYADGSIYDKTTRGDRALWYHYQSINAVVFSMELMRAAGVTPSEKLEAGLHRAVDLFAEAVMHPDAVMDKWAKQNVRARYEGTQDWDATWANGDQGGSWVFIYQYRYPERDSSKLFAKIVKPTVKSATNDNDIGMGVGCLYNAAALGRLVAEGQ
jgi:hypothetical protein